MTGSATREPTTSQNDHSAVSYAPAINALLTEALPVDHVRVRPTCMLLHAAHRPGRLLVAPRFMSVSQKFQSVLQKSQSVWDPCSVYEVSVKPYAITQGAVQAEVEAEVTGELPRWLDGALYKNGPASFKNLRRVTTAPLATPCELRRNHGASRGTCQDARMASVCVRVVQAPFRRLQLPCQDALCRWARLRQQQAAGFLCLVRPCSPDS